MKHLASIDINNISDYISDILLELNDDGYSVYNWPSSDCINFRISNGNSKKLESSDIEYVVMRIFKYLISLNIDIDITTLDYDKDDYFSFDIDLDQSKACIIKRASTSFRYVFDRSYSKDFNGVMFDINFKNNK